MKLSEDQIELQRLARDFAQREIAPRSAAGDQEGKIPTDLLAKIKELGLLNLRVPEQFGGLGLTTLDAAIVTEEFATACSGIASATEISELALTPLLLYGTENQKEALLSDIAARGALLGYALGPSSVLAKTKSGAISISGKCDWVLNPSVAERLFIRFSLVDKAGNFGAYVFTKSEGLATALRPNILGRKAQDVGSCTLTNVTIAEGELIDLGETPDSFETRLGAHDFSIQAAVAVGIANAALQHAIAYSKERRTFGKEIYQHQAVSFMLADMKKDITAARLLVWQAAQAVDQGHNAASLYLACKTYAHEIAIGVATDAVQIYGGYGYSREYPVEKLMRDAKTLDLPFDPAYELKGSLGRLLLA